MAFSNLMPDQLMDAIESVGLRPDGRLLALNSFENRVYQLGMEEGPPLIAKFYRPGRWSDAAILEEHTFTAELAEREIPVVPPLRIADATLHHFADMRFAVFTRQPGRAPELDDPATLEWLGRFLGRIHAVGELNDFVARPTLDVQSFGIDSRDFLLHNNFLPPDLLPAWQSVAEQALEGVAHCYARVGKVGHLRLHGDCRIVIGCQTTIVSQKHWH